MKKSFVVYKKYLKIPSDYTADSVVAIITDQEERIDYVLSPADKSKEYTYIDVQKYIGKAITVECEKEFSVKQSNSYPLKKQYKNRPYVHYTTPFGHINDPCGLYYKDGVYHIYYQNYPYSPSCKQNNLWIRQNWGYATTKDFIKFNYHGLPIRYDYNGAAWSGSAYVDRQNVSGLGSKDNPAVLYYWTLCGKPTPCSQQKPYVQILSCSTDDGKTLVPKGVCLENVKAENRDPKVIFCAKLGCYIMALFLEEPNLFGLFKSKNLITWELFQEISMESGRECPNLYTLTADDGKEKWIFSTASGTYLVGDFKKGKFVASQPQKRGLYTEYVSATQVFEGKEDVSISWMHLPYADGLNFAGALTFPVQQKLKKVGKEYVILQKPYNIEKLFKSHKNLPDGEQNLDLKNKPYYLKMNLVAKGVQHLKINNHVCTVDFEQKVIYLNEKQFSFDCGDMLSLEVLIDKHCLEFFVEDGLYYASVCKPHDKMQTLLVLPQTANSIQLFGLKHLQFTKAKK